MKTSEVEKTEHTTGMDEAFATLMREGLVAARIGSEAIDVEVFEALSECNSHLLDKVKFRTIDHDGLQKFIEKNQLLLKQLGH